MTTRLPLAAELLAGAHRRLDLDAAGVHRREVEGPLWRPAGHGFHAWAAGGPPDTRQRLAEVSAMLPDGAGLTGWAAAFLHGAEWLDGLTADRDHLPVPVAMQPAAQVRRGPGIRPMRSRLDADDLVEVAGMPVTRVERAAFDLARSAAAETALVGLDAMVRFCGLDPAALGSYTAERPRWKGVGVVRVALGLVDGRVRSPQESRLRYVWVVEAGLPRPEVNVEVFHADGWLIGLPDLLDPASGLVGEYDGVQHTTLEQHTADNAREEDFETAGLTVVRSTSVDLGPQRRRLVSRLTGGHRRALVRGDSPRRWFLAPGCSRHAVGTHARPGVS